MFTGEGVWDEHLEEGGEGRIGQREQSGPRMVQADPKGGSAANLGPSQLSEWAMARSFSHQPPWSVTCYKKGMTSGKGVTFNGGSPELVAVEEALLAAGAPSCSLKGDLGCTSLCSS